MDNQREQNPFPWGAHESQTFALIFLFQGDANRSYSDEDQSSSNMEDFDKFQDSQDVSGQWILPPRLFLSYQQLGEKCKCAHLPKISFLFRRWDQNALVLTKALSWQCSFMQFCLF